MLSMSVDKDRLWFTLASSSCWNCCFLRKQRSWSANQRNRGL